MGNLGVKQLNTTNWLEAEAVMSAFVSLSLRDGAKSPITAQDWLERFTSLRLSQTVPSHVVERFEIARGVAIYGYFFYPLFTQALVSLLIVAEASISTKFKLIGPPKRRRRFRLVEKLDYLLAENAISPDEHEKWQFIRQMRNLAVHSDSQMILMPGDVLSLSRNIVDRINFLFN
jgi:hypothetical protein